MINRDVSIVAIKGTLDPTNATDDVFANGSTNYDYIIRDKIIPVGVQSSPIYLSQDKTEIKINFYYNSSYWMAGLSRTIVTGLAAVNTVYCRA